MGGGWSRGREDAQAEPPDLVRVPTRDTGSNLYISSWLSCNSGCPSSYSLKMIHGRYCIEGANTFFIF